MLLPAAGRLRNLEERAVGQVFCLSFTAELQDRGHAPRGHSKCSSLIPYVDKAEPGSHLLTYKVSLQNKRSFPRAELMWFGTTEPTSIAALPAVHNHVWHTQVLVGMSAN